MSDYKQVIVIRKDLNMRKGKMVAQGAHASVGAVIKNLNDERIKNWLAGPFTKICVSIDSEKELLDLNDRAINEKLIVCLIKDNGLTEFNGVQTYTALAIGPDKNEIIDRITGHLKLL